MMPLALYLRKMGVRVLGSDRSYDRGENPGKFKQLKEAGVEIFPQDGSGIHAGTDILVVSSAIEDSIPDVRAALDLKLPIIKRGALLADVFNIAKRSVAVAGTSGKSTVTGMISTILVQLDLDPSFVNGGLIRMTGENDPLAVHCGREDTNYFAAEMDESDGSIAHYKPYIGILHNISHDHKSMEELEDLFGNYLSRITHAAVINFDDFRVRKLAEDTAYNTHLVSYGLESEDAMLKVQDIVLKTDSCDFTLVLEKELIPVTLNVTGRYNVLNALAALGACHALGLDLAKCAQALLAFRGIHRRMERVGKRSEITVFDDFAHNPDKISASLQALKHFDGRLIVMFQPHGFGPLKLMGAEMMDVFARYLGLDDYLLMPEAYYAGGTVDRSVTARNLIDSAQESMSHAHWFERREDILPFIMQHAQPGDRIIVMGARDDTLHDFAKQILALF